MKEIIANFKDNFFDYLFLGSIILISDDSFLFGSGASPNVVMFKYIFLFCITLNSIVKYGLSRNQKHMLIVIISLTLISAILSFSFISGGLLILIFTMILAIETTNKYTLYNFSKIFVNLIFYLNIYSLCIWIIVSMRIVEPNVVENVIGVEILSLKYCNFFAGSVPGFLRASSIFREPGMYMIFICLSYILEIFVLRRNIGLIRIITYFLSILSTFSTAGFIIFGLLLICSSIGGYKRGSLKRIIICIGLLFTVIVFIKNNEIAEYVFGKFVKGEDSASYLGRESSIMIPLNMIIQSPFWGSGIANFKLNYILLAHQIYHTTIDPDGMATNTILNLAAIFGLPLCIIIMYGVYKFSNNLKISQLKKVIIFLCILMMFSNESAPYSILLYWIAFYGFFPNSQIKRINK